MRQIERALRVEFVMPGLGAGIHVLAAPKYERRGWPGRSPAMTSSSVHLDLPDGQFVDRAVESYF